MELIITPKEELAKLLKDTMLEIMANNHIEKSEEKTDDKYMSLTQLIHFLNPHPARQTVYGWVNKRIIPYRKRGRSLYFLKSEIENWLDRGRQISNDDKLK